MASMWEAELPRKLKLRKGSLLWVEGGRSTQIGRLRGPRMETKPFLCEKMVSPSSVLAQKTNERASFWALLFHLSALFLKNIQVDAYSKIKTSIPIVSTIVFQLK